MKDKQQEFLEAYLPVQDNIWRYCLFMAKDRDLARDLLGETIAAAWQRFDSIREHQAFLGWLFTVASRTLYRLRGKSRFELTDPCKLDELFISDLNQEVLTDISFLYESLNKLPEDQKETIILFSIEGFSRKEIAVMQNVSEETVKSRLSRGRKQLAILMGAQDE